MIQLVLAAQAAGSTGATTVLGIAVLILVAAAFTGGRGKGRGKTKPRRRGPTTQHTSRTRRQSRKRGGWL